MLLDSLRTNRLFLRPFTAIDMVLMQRLDLDAEVVRFLGSGRVRSEDETAANLAKIISDYNTFGSGLFAVYHSVSGEFVGRSGLIPWLIDGDLIWEIGYSFVRSAWGQGYATECAGKLKIWALKHLTVPFVVSLIHPENIASINVAEKIGMKFDKTILVGELSLSVYRT